MEKSEIENKNSKLGVDDENNLTRKELQAWGSKIIADARPKNKKNRVSRKQYIENMEMKEKWWNHYGRGPWY